MSGKIGGHRFLLETTIPTALIESRIIKTISKGVVLIISPFLKKLYCRSSCLLYNQNKHCGFVSIKLQHVP